MSVSVALSPVAIQQFFDNLGNPAAGGSVLTQVASVNYATYQDSGGTTPLPNPIPLNSRGEISNAAGVSCQLFLVTNTVYTFTLYDVNGNQLNQATYVASPPPAPTAIVASAATGADIWSPGPVISWTGVATTTAFGAAPFAGARSLLVCAGACKFTAGANLLITGIPSGSTVTMNSTALVEVLALTTTKFQLRYSLYGSFTATGTGFSAGGTATWYFSVNDGVVTISNPAFSGTSNATTFTITGFPAEISPTGTLNIGPIQYIDNSAYASTGFGQLSSAGVLSLFTTPLTGVWTNSGSKGVLDDCFTYSVKA